MSLIGALMVLGLFALFIFVELTVASAIRDRSHDA